MIIKVVDTDTVPADFKFNYDELDGVTLKDLLNTMVEVKGNAEDANQLVKLESDDNDVYSKLLSTEVKTLVDILNGEFNTFCEKLFERDYEYCKDIYSSIA